MDSTFTEFSYGYTVTEELVTGVLGYQKVRPMFPSLHDEGQAGGGYDVALPYIGAPLYLQFKRSHYMVRRYAENWDLFNSEYFRMYLMPQRYSQQHELLIHLELSGNDVYYIAPEFYTDEQLAEHYENKAVFEHSTLFVPSDIGHLNDDERHYIAFNDGIIAYVCSDKPRELKKNIKGKNYFQETRPQTLEKGKRIDEKFFNQLIDNSIELLEQGTILSYTLADTLKRSRIIRQKAETISEKARYAGFLARAYFGCELFIVGE